VAERSESLGKKMKSNKIPGSKSRRNSGSGGQFGWERGRARSSEGWKARLTAQRTVIRVESWPRQQI